MVSPFRILMTADALSSVWSYAMELARALGSRGIEIELAVMGPTPSREQRADAAFIGNIHLNDRPFALEWMRDPWADVAKAGEWLLELEARFCPDVVHLNSFCHGSLPWSAPVLTAVHSCGLVRDRCDHGQPLPSGWTRYRTEVLAGLRGADLLVAPTHGVLDSLKDIYGLSPRASHLRVISHTSERLAESYCECYRELAIRAPASLSRV